MTSSLLLNYHDALIYSGDLALLAPNAWLNDRIINFCFRYFENEEPKIPDSILLMDPAVVSFIATQCNDESDYDSVYSGQSMGSKDVVMFPCTDSMDFETRPTHWSLVVYVHQERTAYSIDSCGHYNDRAAFNLCRKIAALYK